jgi:hypothetical protein
MNPILKENNILNEIKLNFRNCESNAIAIIKNISDIKSMTLVIQTEYGYKNCIKSKKKYLHLKQKVLS